MKGIILQGSSRSYGNTNKVVRFVLERLPFELIDLKTKYIHQYDYEHKHESDDFLPLMRTIVEYDIILFATPVYWYAMSGTMKIFFDRFSDLLHYRKDLGRQLRGKSRPKLNQWRNFSPHPHRALSGL